MDSDGAYGRNNIKIKIGCRNDGSNLLVHVTFSGGSCRQDNKTSGSKTSGECGECEENIRRVLKKEFASWCYLLVAL